VTGPTRRHSTRAVLLALALWPAGARSQDFDLPAPPYEGGAGAAIERGLPPAARGASVECGAVRWLGLGALDGRSVAAAAGWRAMRVSAGLAQTGDAALGWSAAGAALGMGGGLAGAALRAVARRDRSPASAAIPPAEGIEAGFGAWVAPGDALLLWTSAPQAWTDGEPPPLARGLVLGARVRASGLSLWLARETVRAGPDPAPRGEHFAGVSGIAGRSRSRPRSRATRSPARRPGFRSASADRGRSRESGVPARDARGARGAARSGPARGRRRGAGIPGGQPR
jgi:hypothetical protein